MIEVTVRKDGIEVEGHAGYAEPGHDIVCAAVSVLFQTLIRSINDLADDKIEYSAPGMLKYRDLSERSKTLIDSFFVGICAVAAEYPKYVKIK